MAFMLSDRNGVGMKNSPRCTFIRRRDTLDKILKGGTLGKEVAIAVQRPFLSRKPRPKGKSIQNERCVGHVVVKRFSKNDSPLQETIRRGDGAESVLCPDIFRGLLFYFVSSETLKKKKRK